jgi:hypothetical protein
MQLNPPLSNLLRSLPFFHSTSIKRNCIGRNHQDFASRVFLNSDWTPMACEGWVNPPLCDHHNLTAFDT